MEPLRAQVAEKIMGWKPPGVEVDAFDTDIEHAMRLVDRMLTKGWEFHLERRIWHREWIASFENKNIAAQARGHTAPLAICRAALEAVL